MITTHLMGGMGNQMFQYAIARAAAIRLNTGVRLYTAGYDADWRVYSLGLWRGITAPTCRDYLGPVIKEQGMPYSPQTAAQIKDPCTLYGYWQTERYFAEIKGVLQEEFQPRQPLPLFAQGIEQKIMAEGEKSAFLTIRRTDYVTTPFHGLLPMEYYQRAAELIASKAGDPCFFVFSDEPEWVEANFKLPYRMIVSGNYDRTVKPHLGREDAELYLMGLCRHAVMANSSYSWWGAWLGRADNGGVTIAPRQWFGPDAKQDTRDIIPDRWVKI